RAHLVGNVEAENRDPRDPAVRAAPRLVDEVGEELARTLRSRDDHAGLAGRKRLAPVHPIEEREIPLLLRLGVRRFDRVPRGISAEPAIVRWVREYDDVLGPAQNRDGRGSVMEQVPSE